MALAAGFPGRSYEIVGLLGTGGLDHEHLERFDREAHARAGMLDFFVFCILVIAASTAAGSIVALLLVAYRKATQDSDRTSVHRLT